MRKTDNYILSKGLLTWRSSGAVVGPHVVRLLVRTQIIYLTGKDLDQLSNSAEKIMASGK